MHATIAPSIPHPSLHTPVAVSRSGTGGTTRDYPRLPEITRDYPRLPEQVGHRRDAQTKGVWLYGQRAEAFGGPGGAGPLSLIV